MPRLAHPRAGRRVIGPAKRRGKNAGDLLVVLGPVVPHATSVAGCKIASKVLEPVVILHRHHQPCMAFEFVAQLCDELVGREKASSEIHAFSRDQSILYVVAVLAQRDAVEKIDQNAGVSRDQAQLFTRTDGVSPERTEPIAKSP